MLILPNAACLSSKALDTIRAFVKAGGGLVAMHESSLCNEFGDRRADFGLADVYGAHFKGTEDFSARWPNYPKWTEVYVGITRPDLHPITDDPVVRSNYRRGSDRLQYIGWMTNVEATAGAVKLGRRLSVPKEWPFMVLNQPGHGRSVYFAEDIGQAYFIAPYQYQRRLISNAVRWAAGSHAAAGPGRVRRSACRRRFTSRTAASGRSCTCSTRSIRPPTGPSPRTTRRSAKRPCRSLISRSRSPT